MLKYSRLEILKLLFNIQIKKKKSLRGCRKYSNNSRNQMARAGLTASKIEGMLSWQYLPIKADQEPCPCRKYSNNSRTRSTCRLNGFKN